MHKLISRTLLLGLTATCFAIPPIRLTGQAGYWPTYAGNTQHTAISGASAQPLQSILWSAPVDFMPQYSNSDLLTHYGSPLITRNNTVIVPQKTGATSGFQLAAFDGLTGTPKWTMTSDYVLPSHNWVPSCGASLVLFSSVVMPGSGGKVLFRVNSETTTSTVNNLLFYGTSEYTANKTWCDSNIQIVTPLTADARGAVFFGYKVVNSASAPDTTLASLGTGGIAKVTVGNLGWWKSAGTSAGDPTMLVPQTNCAPGISNDGSKVYIAFHGSSQFNSRLASFKANDLTPLASVKLKDPKSNAGAATLDDGTSSPTVAPDGDVYFGIYPNTGAFPYQNNYRGWLLRFSPDLVQRMIPNTTPPKAVAGAFGWDDTVAIVPPQALPAGTTTSTSPYFVMTKYNNYGEAAGSGNGDGQNKMAVLDPNNFSTERYSSLTCMNEVLTVLGVTPDSSFPSLVNPVREWCVNTGCIDVVGQCAVVNSEDGKCYRWDFKTNSLSEVVTLTGGVGEAYTMTIIGPTGISYFINNATLFAVGKTTPKSK